MTWIIPFRAGRSTRSTIRPAEDSFPTRDVSSTFRNAPFTVRIRFAPLLPQVLFSQRQLQLFRHSFTEADSDSDQSYRLSAPAETFSQQRFVGG